MSDDAHDPPADPPESAWEIARQAGVDMDLLEDCLRLTPEERIRVHSLALQTGRTLREALLEWEEQRNKAPAAE